MDSQMQKGLLEMCLLHMIAEQETYGYELLRRTAEAFPGVQERTVYSILRRLYEAGYVASFMGRASEGPPRKYYRVTEAGSVRLQKLAGDWAALRRSVEKVGVGAEETNDWSASPIDNRGESG